MASRLKRARAGAAVAGASVALLMTTALPAAADAATGTVDPDRSVGGYNVNVGKDNSNIKTNLIGFKLTDGTELQMYCVEINTAIDREHDMVEQPWDKYPNASSPFHKNRDKINWILHHGYPVASEEALATLLTEQGAQLTDGIDVKEAIAATQAAVWHFSDGTDLNKEDPLPSGSDEADADVLALYEYLTGKANVGIGDQPTPALAVAPGEKSGKAGEKIGPFTVTTTGEIEKLTTKLPEGVKLTDAKGTELTAETIKNGTEVFISVPADAKEGAGAFEVTASASVDTGRLFVGKNYAENPTQSLIVAKAEKSEIVASAGAKWTETAPPTSTTTTPPTTSETPPTTSSSAPPVPQPKNTSGDLASTGASVAAPLIIGVVLVGAGIGALLFLRHRKRA